MEFHAQLFYTLTIVTNMQQAEKSKLQRDIEDVKKAFECSTEYHDPVPLSLERLQGLLNKFMVLLPLVLANPQSMDQDSIDALDRLRKNLEAWATYANKEIMKRVDKISAGFP